KMMAVLLRFSCHVVFLLQPYVMNTADGGAYYGPKQPPQQQPQPIPQYSDDFPQQQFLGNEMPHSPFSKGIPSMSQHGKDAPQLPLPLQIGKIRPLTKGKGDDKPSQGDLKVLFLFLVGKVSQVDLKALKAPLDQWALQVHKAPLGFQDRGFLDHQESQVPRVLRDTREMENLECQDCLENLEALDYQEQKGILDQLVVKGQQDFPGLQDSQVPLDSLEFQNQEARGYQDCKGNQENLAKMVHLGFLVLKVQKAIKGLDCLVFQV
ncbi:hypothetical protein CCH79_00013341, partial [Gambusia affinis]